MKGVAEVAPIHLDALAELFRACECPCYCQYWHFDGDKNAWLERCAQSPEMNEAALRADVGRGEARATGLVALDGSRVMGWMKLAPRATLPKLRGRSVYRTLDLGPDDGVLSIACMLVHPEARGTGIARALVTAATKMAHDRGAHAIEAYPHARSGLGAHEAWMGPYGLLLSVGFKRVAGDDVYPVLRFTV